MPEQSLDVPIVLLIFNRPNLTRQVFSAIRKARPRRLFVVADGPRKDRPGDVADCLSAQAIVKDVDWPCLVEMDVSEENLGCMKRVSSGLDWVFDQAEEAIILEDDCLPHPSFFPYCTELLSKYRDVPQIGQVAGANFQFGQVRSEFSYYYSRYSHVWGWATWRRAWQLNDNSMSGWDEFRDSGKLEQTLSSRREVKYWKKLLDKVARGQVDSWACRWTLSCWQQGMLTILPEVNLVSNLGFDSLATHTQEANSRFSQIPALEMAFPLKHPPEITQNLEADEFTAGIMFREQLLSEKILAFFRGVFDAV